MDWVDKPGKPRLVFLICFGVFLAKKNQKTPKQTGMASLGSPGFSSQSVWGFSGRKGPKKPETDLGDKPGKPMLVTPVRFRVFWV